MTMLQATINVASNDLLTEQSDVRAIARALQHVGIDGASIAPGWGMDSGQLERSYAITVSQYGMPDPEVFKARVRRAALRLRDVFAQQCVLVTWSDVTSDCTHDYAPGAPDLP